MKRRSDQDEHPAGDDASITAALWSALEAVVDPELGASIVELGMVRDVRVAGGAATIALALTTAACPLRDRIRKDVELAARRAGVAGVVITLAAMDASERAALMARARRSAQERSTVADAVPGARVLGVVSGKGGVGKSSVSVNLAVALARLGATVGLLDADIWGFSVPRMLGLEGSLAVRAKKMQPQELAVDAGRLRVVSMGFLASEDDAIMWRGLILNRAVQHFLEDVDWGGLDYLLIDMPPGTGDVQMGLARMVPRTELLVVTTPALAAQKVAGRAADMARRGHLRVAGVIENMAGFTADDGRTYAIFGEGGGERLAEEIGAPLLGSIPIDPRIAAGGDTGSPVAASDLPAGRAFLDLARRVRDELDTANMASCSARLEDALRRSLTAAR